MKFPHRRPFRGLTAPASLKLVSFPASVTSFPTFRGLTAPASLKPDLILLPYSNLWNFPGPHSPGLIEACRRRAAGRRGRPAFRGLTAPASLKLHDERRIAVGRTPPFRGLTAPASLKPLVALPNHNTAGVFPGPHSPGLIEARCDSFFILSCNGLSGASQPRPH